MKSLRYIVAIADEKSITKAAERLFVAQPSLSQFLQKYESDLGCRIFQRYSKGVCLTGAGEKFVPKARKLVEMYDQMVKEMRLMCKTQKKMISFATSIFRGEIIIPELLQRFYSKNSNIVIDCHEIHPKEIERQLAKGEIDIALVVAPVDNPNICCQVVAHEEVYLAVSKSHPILEKARVNPDTNKKWIDIRDMASEKFILLENEWRLRAFSDRIFAKYGIHPSFEIASLRTTFGFAAESLGVIFCPQVYIVGVGMHSDKLQYLSIGPNGEYRDLLLAYSNRYEVLPAYIKDIVEIVTTMLRCPAS
ncbi:LysR family transcriptional regulator [Synergistes jonesii]|uniref:LysR family transcriptional regulator n=1 Tax=Synergistes jonesii TaxID=2754 RepID=UPI00242C7069|nr:LysR family transcriptional regulator [Synergistes jonesii]